MLEENIDNLINITPTDIEKKIQKIKGLNLETISCDGIFNEIKDLMAGYKLVYFPGRNYLVYRAGIEKGDRDFQKVSDLWYPPKDKVKKISRANFIGESVFYCSNKPETAVLELYPNKDDIVAIMECKINAKELEIALKELA